MSSVFQEWTSAPATPVLMEAPVKMTNSASDASVTAIEEEDVKLVNDCLFFSFSVMLEINVTPILTRDLCK